MFGNEVTNETKVKEEVGLEQSQLDAFWLQISSESLIYLSTWRTYLTEKLIVAHLVKKFLVFCGGRSAK
jgi:hypothetical protein